MKTVFDPFLFSDAYGSAGELTAYHHNGRCRFRRRTAPGFPRTAGQAACLELHRRALAAWRGLPHGTQLRWNALAEAVEPHKPPFDHLARISGHNLFVSAYHGFATLGCEHVPDPMPFEPFPPFAVELLDARSERADLVIPVRLTIRPEGNPSRYRLLCKLQLAAPGKGCHPGLLRNYLAEGTAGEDAMAVRVPAYVSRCGLDLDAYQVHARLLLLDTRTGYRSQYHGLSSLISVDVCKEQ